MMSFIRNFADLFALLMLAKDFKNVERKHAARRLVSGYDDIAPIDLRPLPHFISPCRWYYVCTQLDYEPEDPADGDLSAFDPANLMKALTEGLVDTLCTRSSLIVW